ncbi:hypothetical protein SLNWT_4987 [Streptomyces albus]|uniref:Lipoprotein n=1 Tax=Streptomyces albus (strain ATCC 21838 / DSM 41398 / FERM P-419 / JCM 4703 / NBRC 107858) TaxID=1081613 RepID=A0A0B5ERD1_STRA4|nr:hypothetical protein SLNWT_4987 [Streptomyces albus]AOU79670.1 hypothetical protein SLNHY_4979 [Streptomyces albus]
MPNPPNRRTTRWLRAAAPVAVLAWTLTACGGGDSGTEGAEGARKDVKGSGSAAAPTASEAAGGGTADSGDGGDSGRAEADGRKAGHTFEVKAEKVDVGTEAEAVELAAARGEGRVPATAHLRFTNRGATIAAAPRTGTIEVRAHGRPGTPVTRHTASAEGAAGCEDQDRIRNWKRGETHVLCATALVPRGAGDLEVRWVKDASDGFSYSWDFKNAAQARG